MRDDDQMMETLALLLGGADVYPGQHGIGERGEGTGNREQDWEEELLKTLAAGMLEDAAGRPKEQRGFQQQMDIARGGRDFEREQRGLDRTHDKELAGMKSGNKLQDVIDQQSIMEGRLPASIAGDATPEQRGSLLTQQRSAFEEARPEYIERAKTAAMEHPAGQGNVALDRTLGAYEQEARGRYPETTEVDALGTAMRDEAAAALSGREDFTPFQQKTMRLVRERDNKDMGLAEEMSHVIPGTELGRGFRREWR